MGKKGLAASEVLDAGALVALERGDRRARALIETAEGRLIIPAPVLAQVWRDGARQTRVATLIKARTTVVEAFDKRKAKAAGVLLARSGTSDVVDASIVLAARLHRAVVVTSDAADLHRIDPSLAIDEI